jgi:hypothetical protein
VRRAHRGAASGGLGLAEVFAELRLQRFSVRELISQHLLLFLQALSHGGHVYVASRGGVGGDARGDVPALVKALLRGGAWARSRRGDGRDDGGGVQRRRRISLTMIVVVASARRSGVNPDSGP